MWEINKYLIVVFIIYSSLCTSLSAQTSSYTFQSHTQTPLQEAIKTLEQSYAIEFSYSNTAIKDILIKKGNYQANNLDELIELFLSDTGLEFQIIDERNILLRPQTPKELSRNSASADYQYTVSGYIFNENHDPVSYANIALDTLSLGSTTNDDGYFQFVIPNDLSHRNIKVQFIGYHTLSVSAASIKNNPKIYLKPTSLNLDEVLIVSKIPSIEIKPILNSNQVQAQYLNKMITPVISNDIIRGVQMLAGVSATNDASAEIKIRGSQADETLIMLDGIPIYKADHFYGIFGSVNGNHIQTAALHKNSMPINFGGKSGGMLELSSADIVTKTTGILDVNMLTSALTVKTPISNNLGLIISGRTTYNNAADSQIFGWIEPNLEEDILNAVISEGDRPLLLQTFPEIQFFDWNTKLIFQPSANDHFSFSIFNSRDNYNNGYNISFENRQTIGSVNGKEEFSDIEETENFGLSLQYKGKWKNNWNSEVSLYQTQYRYDGGLSTSLNLNRNNNNAFFNLTNEKENTITDYGGHLSLSKKYKTNNILTLGASAVHHDILFNFSADDTRSFEISANGIETAIFGQYLWKPSEEWNIQFGSRFDYYSGTERIYYNPRLDISRTINSTLSLKSSISRNYQFLREVTHYTRLREPIDVYMLTSEIGAQKYPVGAATNSMLGATYSKNNWTLDVELYHRDLDGVIEHTQEIVGNNIDQNKIPVRNYQTVIGDGKVIGLDWTIGYESKVVSSWLAYTLSKATNRFEDLFLGEAIPSSDDRRHQLKWSNQIEIKNWLIHSGYVFSSGLNQINLFELDEPLNQRDILKPNTFIRLDAYHRLDLGVDYKFELFNADATIGLSVFNLTNNDNVDYIQYLFAIPRIRNNANRAVLSGTTTQLLDRTFNLSFKMNW